MAKAKAIAKGKGKSSSWKGKENACPSESNNNGLSDRKISHRARREQEMYERRENGQRLRRECERSMLASIEPPERMPCRRPRTCSNTEEDDTTVIAPKRTMLEHPSCMPSTSYVPPPINWSTIPELIPEVDLCSDSDNEVESLPVNASADYRAHSNSVRHFLGPMNVECPHCKALHWMDEKLANSSVKRPLFGTCCKQGKIRLPPLREPPPQLKALYDGNDEQSKSFRKHTRIYNTKKDVF